MDTYKFFLAFPAALLLIGCVYHCRKTKGLRLTLILFGLGIPVFWVREFLASLYNHYQGIPQYFHPYGQFYIGSVPLPVIGGWLLNTYLGWQVAERIVERIPLWKGRLMPVIGISALVISSMALAIEATGIELGWWVWAKQDIYQSTDMFKEFLHRVPLVALQGWPAATLWFLVPVLVLECSPLKYKSNLRWLAAFPWWVLYFILLQYYFLWARLVVVIVLALLIIFLKTQYLPPKESPRDISSG